ncbi:MAG: hypothetical protein PUD15_00675 [Prevotella sp.]|nr:hypothetical protein [Prevotella sp.]
MTKLIALNPQHAGNKGRISALTLADYDRLIHEDWLRQQVAEIRAGNKALKAQLPFRSPHYYAFKDNKRCQAAILPDKFLFQTCVDIDDADKVAAAIDKARSLDANLGKWHDKLLHMEYSASKKLHIDLRLPVGMTIEEAQKEYSELMGIPYDKSCITPERIIFITSADDELYRSDEWYNIMPDDDLKMYQDALTDRGLTIDGRKPKNSSNYEHHSVFDHSSAHPLQPRVPVLEKTTERYVDRCSRRNLIIFDLCRQAAGLGEVDINAEGSRHSCLLSIMSVGAARLMARQELESVVAQKMPAFYQESDCRDLIRDFYDKYHDGSKAMSSTCQRILAQAETEVARQDGKQVAADEDLEPPKHSWDKINPKRMPIGLKQCLCVIPPKMIMPVLCAILPLAGAYADQVELEYCDGSNMHLGLMSIIVGDQASGKSVCKHVVDAWRKILDDDDAQARKIEDEWKEKRKARKANERAPEDPHVLIRVVPPTISCSSLLRREKNSRGHCLYSFGEELDTLRKSNGAGSWANKYDVYRMGFDRSEWGQDYNSDQAESGIVKVAYNWTMLGTYGALRKCFKSDNVENGLSSRMIISEMPDNSFAKMPHYNLMSPKDLEAVYAAARKLKASSGKINTPKLRKTIGKWVEDKRIEAMKNDDHVMDTYRKRAAVIGFRAGCIYFLLSGKEDKRCCDFATMMADYVLYEQMKTFGELLKECDEQYALQSSRRTVNKCIFDQIGKIFTIQDLMNIKGPDCQYNTAKTIVCRWKKAGWIRKSTNGTWVKAIGA